MFARVEKNSSKDSVEMDQDQGKQHQQQPSGVYRHMLQLVFRYFGDGNSLADLIHMMRVCKYWYTSISSHRRVDLLPYFDNQPEFDRFHSFIKSNWRLAFINLELYWMSPSVISMLSEEMSHLQTLDFCPNDDEIIHSFAFPQGLRKLRLYLPLYLGKPKTSENYKLYLYAIGELGDVLEELNLGLYLVDLDLSPLLKLNSLRKFNFGWRGGGMSITDEQLSVISTMTRTLTSLGLLDGIISVDLLKRLLDLRDKKSAATGGMAESSLQIFELDQTPITDEFIPLILRMPTLTELSPVRFDCTSFSWLKSMSQLRILHADFDSWKHIPDTADDLTSSLKTCWNLTDLELTGHSSINEKHLISLFSHVPNLIHLRLSIDVKSLNSFMNASFAATLESFSITTDKHLVDFSPLLALRSLRTIHIRHGGNFDLPTRETLQPGSTNYPYLLSVDLSEPESESDEEIE